MAYDPNATLARIVADRPNRSRRFGRLGLDTCCGGKRPRGEACAERGLDAARVLSSLEAHEARAGSPTGEIDLSSAAKNELIDHVLSRRHRSLREEPGLFPLLASEEPHGEEEPPAVSGYAREREEMGAPARRLRELSDDYRASEWACNGLRAFSDGLRELEAHIHERAPRRTTFASRGSAARTDHRVRAWRRPFRK